MGQVLGAYAGGDDKVVAGRPLLVCDCVSQQAEAHGDDGQDRKGKGDTQHCALGVRLDGKGDHSAEPAA
jgi:hypothetical protein